jgi:hypothetical protein
LAKCTRLLSDAGRGCVGRAAPCVGGSSQRQACFLLMQRRHAVALRLDSLGGHSQQTLALAQSTQI